MKRRPWFLLLVPVIVLLALLGGVAAGYPLPFGTTGQAMFALAAWTLLFLIVHGTLRGWRSVRLFLVVWIALKFGAIGYCHFSYDVGIRTTIMRLGVAALATFMMVLLFWPARRRIAPESGDLAPPQV